MEVLERSGKGQEGRNREEEARETCRGDKDSQRG